MRRFLRTFVYILCICLLLSGCSKEDSDRTSVERIPKATTAPAPAEEVPAPEERREPAPVETQTEDPNLPVLVAPQAPEGTCLFFDDAAIIGDSISYSLMVHNGKTKDLGNATFLVRGSLGIHNTMNGQLTLYYKGASMTPWDALAACGAKKVFIMLGTNDIGYYTIEETITLWGTFLEKIRTTTPDMEIFIISLTPMWKGGEQQMLNNLNIDAYNEQLETLAQENNCYFVNIAPYLKDQENSLAHSYCGDMYVHMNEVGTAAWANLLKAYASGLLP